MQQLIKITESEEGQLVSARDLHDFLVVQSSQNVVGEKFSDWIKRMIEYGFQRDVDYFVYEYDYMGSPINRKSDNQTVSKREYLITVDCAKQISMLQRNDKGFEARKYFIEVEKKARNLVKPMSTLDLLEATIRSMREQRVELDEIKQDLHELKSITKTRPDYFTIVGYATLNGMSIGLKLAQRLGASAAKICREDGVQMESIPDPRFGLVRMYPKYVLESVFNQKNILN